MPALIAGIMLHCAHSRRLGPHGQGSLCLIDHTTFSAPVQSRLTNWVGQQAPMNKIPWSLCSTNRKGRSRTSLLGVMIEPSSFSQNLCIGGGLDAFLIPEQAGPLFYFAHIQARHMVNHRAKISGVGVKCIAYSHGLQRLAQGDVAFNVHLREWNIRPRWAMHPRGPA